MSTPTPVAATLDQTTPATVHQLLRDLRKPAKLQHSPWINAAVVGRAQQAQPTLTPLEALRAVLDEQLTQLAREAPQQAELLRWRFWERKRVADLLRAEQPYRMEERTFYLLQETALKRFAQLLLAAEATCGARSTNQRLLRRLPLPTYETLFGVEPLVAELVALLRDPQRHFIISIKGIGGSGKTALADLTVRRFLAENVTLHDLVWLSAKQEYLTASGIQRTADSAATQIRLESIFDELGQKLDLPAVLRLPLEQKVEKLAGILRSSAHLIVIDNLETVDDFQRLTPWLARLAGPTKFLLTSRATVPSLMRVTSVTLPELDRTASLALIEEIAQCKGVKNCAAAQIYEVVGGNPLALILLVSQMQLFPPAAVLQSVQLGTAEEIYRYIYWKAWEVLPLPTQAVLFAIQRAGDIADWDWLFSISGFSAALLQQALQQLLDLSLVQPQQSKADGRLFTLHRLTATFLRTEVLAGNLDWVQRQLDAYRHEGQLVFAQLIQGKIEPFVLDRALDLLRTYLSLPARVAPALEVDQIMVRLGWSLHPRIHPQGYWHAIYLLWPQLQVLASRLPDPAHYVEVTRQLAITRGDRGEFRAAQHAYEALLASSDFGQITLDQQAGILHQLGVSYVEQGRYADAQQVLARCLTISEMPDDASNTRHELADIPSRISQARCAAARVWEAKAYAHIQLGNIALLNDVADEARHHYEESLRIFLAHREGENLACVPYQALGRLLLICAAFGEAVTWLEKNLAIRQRRSDKKGSAYAAAYLAGAYIGNGKLAAAQELLTGAMATCQTLQDRCGVALCHFYFGHIEHQRGNAIAAQTQWQQAHVLSVTTPIPLLEQKLLAALPGLM